MLINHGGGLFTSYSHMSDWVAEEGDYVDAKDLIGKVGSSWKSNRTSFALGGLFKWQ